MYVLDNMKLHASSMMNFQERVNPHYTVKLEQGANKLRNRR